MRNLKYKTSNGSVWAGYCVEKSKELSQRLRGKVGTCDF